MTAYDLVKLLAQAISDERTHRYAWDKDTLDINLARAVMRRADRVDGLCENILAALSPPFVFGPEMLDPLEVELLDLPEILSTSGEVPMPPADLPDLDLPDLDAPEVR